MNKLSSPVRTKTRASSRERERSLHRATVRPAGSASFTLPVGEEARTHENSNNNMINNKQTGSPCPSTWSGSRRARRRASPTSAWRPAPNFPPLFNKCPQGFAFQQVPLLLCCALCQSLRLQSLCFQPTIQPNSQNYNWEIWGLEPNNGFIFKG